MRNEPVGTMAENLSPDEARLLRDLLLPSLTAEQQTNRAVIGALRNDQLAFLLPGGGSLGDLIWQILAIEHIYLTAISEARIPVIPERPRDKGADAILAWYDAHLPPDLERLARLTGEDLVRRIELLGEAKPAVAFLPVCLRVVYQNHGLLTAYRAMAAAQPVPAIQPRQAGSPRPVDYLDKLHGGAPSGPADV